MRRAPTATLTSVNPACFNNSRQRIVCESGPAIAEAVTDPELVVLAEIEDEHAAARNEDAVRLRRAHAPDPAA